MHDNRLASLVTQHEGELLAAWIKLQAQTPARAASGRTSEQELRTNSHDFVLALGASLATGDPNRLDDPAWAGLRDLLKNLSRQRASQGFSPTETATFVFSFKEALFQQLRETYKNDPQAMTEVMWSATNLLDQLGLYTMEIYQKSREEVIARQQQEMLELSTPVVELWPGILALPLIGTLDSARTQIVMQNLLEAIVAKSADLAIVDITGVPTVDTLVAQHLLKTVAAARLMGAECIISGIRPQIAQTIIHLGVDLSGVITKANFADAFRLSLRKKNLVLAKA